MRRLLLAAALALTAATTALAAPGAVTDSSYAAADGTRTLRVSIDIDAPAAIVWKLFTDPATIKAGGLPGAWVELRNGGVLEEALAPGAGPGDPRNIRHRIITYVPEHLMVLRNENAPPGTPGREAYPRIVQIIEITDLGGGRSRLTLIGAGYGPEPEFRPLWDFFHAHNPEFLTDAKAQAEAMAKKP